MRDERGRWQPGATPNPLGRKPGSGRVARLRKAIEAEIPAILQRLVEAAKAGDVSAARLLVERVVPAVRPVELPAPITMPAGSIADAGRAVLAAAGAGDLAPGQAAALLAGLGALAKVIETTELAERIARLEGSADGDLA